MLLGTCYSSPGKPREGQLLWAFRVTLVEAGLGEGSEQRSLLFNSCAGCSYKPSPKGSARLTSSPLMSPVSLRGYYYCAHFTEEEAGGSGSYVVSMWGFEACQLSRGSRPSFHGAHRILRIVASPARGALPQLSPGTDAQLSTVPHPAPITSRRCSRLS